MGRYGTPFSLGFAAIFFSLISMAPWNARAADIVLGIGANAKVTQQLQALHTSSLASVLHTHRSALLHEELHRLEVILHKRTTIVK